MKSFNLHQSFITYLLKYYFCEQILEVLKLLLDFIKIMNEQQFDNL